MISEGTVFYLPDDQLVEDAVLPLFGLCHQRDGSAEIELGDGSSESSAQSSSALSAYAG
jgi:hypothetical protein